MEPGVIKVMMSCGDARALVWGLFMAAGMRGQGKNQGIRIDIYLVTKACTSWQQGGRGGK